MSTLILAFNPLEGLLLAILPVTVFYLTLFFIRRQTVRLYYTPKAESPPYTTGSRRTNIGEYDDEIQTAPAEESTSDTLATLANSASLAAHVKNLLERQIILVQDKYTYTDELRALAQGLSEARDVQLTLLQQINESRAKIIALGNQR